MSVSRAVLLSRLLLSGNPLDCVCENMWIKLRLLEEADSQDLKCIDERGATKAFATLTPPDCGNVKPCYNKQRRVSDIEPLERRSPREDRKERSKQRRKTNLKTNRSMWSSAQMFSFPVCSFLAVVPRVEVSPRTVTEMQGSDVKALCRASGSPPPEILWNLDLISTHHEVSQSTTRPPV